MRNLQLRLMLPLLLLQLLLLLLLQSAATTADCGYSACPKPVPNRVNVHIVAHTHDDVGWLRTVDQYYYYEVQYIIDTVIEELLANPARKFTYVEIAYFFRWWRQQSQERQNQVKGLVQNGQLQFALGGWCMDDEATTHYVDIIDQHTAGLRFLNDTFGDCGRPRVAWQVDPFGHSKEHTALLAQMGFDAFYFGRIDYQDEALRMQSRRMEVLWKASQDLGSPAGDLFSGKLYGNYCPPPGYSYENGDLPIQDDPRINDYNVENMVQGFVNVVNSRRKVFSSDHLMLTMGCDFQYQNARKNFKNFDKLIDIVNARTEKHNITVYYSTPSCYTKSVNSQNVRWTVKKDDFFPYAHIPHGFWTGYFTSRAALKRYVRLSSNLYQSIKQIAAAAGVQRSFPAAAARMNVMQQAMGVVQHHDGVSGTEKQVVAYDYAQRIANGTNAALPVWQKSWQLLTSQSAYSSMQLCLLTNISSCPFTDSHDTFHVQFYNPMSHSVWHMARIPVRNQYYIVQNHLQQVIKSQTIPINKGTLRIPERRGAKSNFELVFNVTNIPAMGFVVYTVTASKSGKTGVSTFTPIRGSTISQISAGFSSEFFARQLSSSMNGAIDLRYYFGFKGNNSKPEFTSSGAYLFRPTKQQPEQYKPTWRGRVTGPVVNESHVSWCDWAYQVTRNFGNHLDPLAYEENEMTVGPIPFADKVGREVIVNYETGLKSRGEFFTDANGRQILRRVRDYRPTWKLKQSESVAGNYFPINSVIFLNDSSSRFVVLTDRSQGGGSIRNGQLEVMLHRVTINDDSLGVGEPLQERGSDNKGLVVRSSHWIFTQPTRSGGYKRRELANRRFREPVVGFMASKPKVLRWSGLRRALPPNLQVVTLDDWRGDDVKLLRLEHIYQINEDQRFSQKVTVDLRDLFATFSIEEVTELTLAANQEAAKAERLKWLTNQEAEDEEGRNDAAVGFEAKIDGTSVTLAPMQIRTFAVKVKYA